MNSVKPGAYLDGIYFHCLADNFLPVKRLGILRLVIIISFALSHGITQQLDNWKIFVQQSLLLFDIPLTVRGFTQLAFSLTENCSQIQPLQDFDRLRLNCLCLFSAVSANQHPWHGSESSPTSVIMDLKFVKWDFWSCFDLLVPFSLHICLNWSGKI